MKIFVVFLSFYILFFFSSSAFGQGQYFNDNLWGASFSDTDSTDSAVVGVKLKFGSDTGMPSVLSVGLDISELDASTIGYDDMVFVYQVWAGMSYVISDKTTIDFEYRYYSTADFKFDMVKPEYINHNIMIGAHLSF